MKKTLSIVAVAVLLNVAAINAGAATLETGGEIRIRAWWMDNYRRDGAASEFWDQRLRLNLNWPVAEQVRIQVRADIREGMWGDDIPVVAPRPPAEGAAAANKPAAPPPAAESKPPISFDWVNLQFVLPGTPLLVALGRQDVSWGTGFWVQDDARDRFQVAAKLDPVVIVAAYDKFTEVLMSHGTKDDAEGWAVGAVADAVDFRFGLLVAYLRDGSRTRFPAGDMSYLTGDFFAKGKLGPASFQAEFTYGGGTLDRGALGELDMGGLGGYAGLFLRVGPQLTIGLEGAYARGDDPATPGTMEGVFSSDYQGPYSSVIFYNNLDYPGYASDIQTSSPDLDVSVRNAATGKCSAVFAPSRNLSLSGAVLYAAVDQARDGVDKALGWEFDLVATYGITENVSLSGGVGYALLGDYWKSAPISGAGGAKPDDPLACVAAVTARF